MDPSERLKQLSDRANNFQFDLNTPVLRYLRTSKEMERMAFIYASEKEYENAFLLYIKMVTLLVEKLPTHSQYKKLSLENKQTIKKRCVSGLQAAEKIKGILRCFYQEEYKRIQNEIQKKKEEQDKDRQSQNHFQLKKTPMPSPAEIIASSSLSISRSIETPAPTFLPYPTIPHVSFEDKEKISPSAPPVEPTPNMSSCSPPINIDMMNEPDKSSEVKYFPHPPVDRSNKPLNIVIDKSHDAAFSIQDSSSLDGNRKVILPHDLVPKFLKLAFTNTQKNLETCGILTGSLARNVLRITHLVVPKQSSTPDSCTTECEEELFDVQDKYDLITLGWIHTHPTQTSFLSSVDLHTQCSYQQMLPEALAIVCSPKYNTTGMYRLTVPYGLNFITACSKIGFHPHPKEPPLFEDSPLVVVESNFVVQVIDLRS